MVLSGLLDPFRSNFLSPDHLLTGLAQDVLNCCCLALGDEKLQLIANGAIVDALTSNGLIKQPTVFGQKSKTLNSMNLSVICSLLAATVPLFNYITCSDHENTLMRKFLSEMVKFQQLIAYTCWWPAFEVDWE